MAAAKEVDGHGLDVRLDMCLEMRAGMCVDVCLEMCIDHALHPDGAFGHVPLLVVELNRLNSRRRTVRNGGPQSSHPSSKPARVAVAAAVPTDRNRSSWPKRSASMALITAQSGASCD